MTTPGATGFSRIFSYCISDYHLEQGLAIRDNKPQGQNQRWESHNGGICLSRYHQTVNNGVPHTFSFSVLELDTISDKS